MLSETTEITFCVRGVISPLLANIYLNALDVIWNASADTWDNWCVTRMTPSFSAAIGRRRRSRRDVSESSWTGSA